MPYTMNKSRTIHVNIQHKDVAETRGDIVQTPRKAKLKFLIDDYQATDYFPNFHHDNTGGIVTQ